MTPEMEPKLDYSVRDMRLEKLSTLNKMAPLSTPEVNKFQMTWMRTNPDVKPYKVMDDLTFVGIPVFAAGWIIKSEKNSFRQDYNNKHANTRLLTNFKTGIDDYTQYFGPAMTVGLKLGGYEGRSDWGRLLASAAMSYGIMAGLVNGIKYTASEMRHDGSSANSWPSGHTATSFVGATMLHKEYGLTRSPWFSVAGYRGYGFGYSKNVGGDDGSIIKFGLIGSSYGATLRIHRFSTKRPTVDAKNSIPERENVTMEYPLDDPMHVRLMTLDAYYFFNGKRCSYTAAYDQSVIQRRSSGSLMAGAMYYHSTIDFAEDRNADFIYLMNDIGKTKHYQFSIGGGYAYNWVPCKGLLVSGLALLMLTAYNRLDVWHYNSNFRQYFMGEIESISDIPVENLDPKNMNQATVDQDIRDNLRVWPMEDNAYEKQYSRVIPVIDARLSLTYNVGNWFFNTNAQMHRFSFKYDEDKGSLTDWYINASVGVRL